MSISDRMQSLGITLPPPPPRGGLYTPCKQFGDNLVYISGCGPDLGNDTFPKGKLGQDITLENGQVAARNCILNALAVLQRETGSLDKVKSIAKILVFVASDNAFYLQPQVANGASQALVDIFGEEVGCPARSAIGVNVLPGNIPVEVELLVELA